jgi:isoleucyl-tRNA synthetase
VHNFAVVDMSNLYLNIVKDRLYVLDKNDPSRRAVQTALEIVLHTMTVIIAPVLSFTAEEIWSHMPHRETESVLLADWPKLPAEYEDEALAQRWDTIFRVRESVNAVLEKGRRERLIGNSLEALIDLYPNENLFAALKDYRSQLAAIYIVSDCRLHEAVEEPEKGSTEILDAGLYISLKMAPGSKCARCWMISPTVRKLTQDGDICARCAGILHGEK